MPWYQAGAARGYSKFYTNPATRTEEFVVSDTYLNALEGAYRQGFFDAGGSNIEDTGALVFDHLAEQGVRTTQDAYAVGRADAANERDIGGTPDNPQNYVAGAPIVDTPPLREALSPMPQPERRDVLAIGQWTPAEASPYAGLSSFGGFGPSGSAFSSAAPTSNGATSGARGLSPLVLLAVAGAAVYFLSKRS